MSKIVTDEEIAQARRAARDAAKVEPRAIEARYDARTKRIVVELKSGAEVRVPTRLIQGLSGATPRQLSDIEILGDGLALHWEELNADITVPGLARGIFGTVKWMEELKSAAVTMGRQGGRVRSAAKTAAVRANGQKGGRPRKEVVA